MPSGLTRFVEKEAFYTEQGVLPFSHEHALFLAITTRQIHGHNRTKRRRSNSIVLFID